MSIHHLSLHKCMIIPLYFCQLQEIKSNFFVHDFTSKEQNYPNGSVLTLVQSLDFKKYSSNHSISLSQYNPEVKPAISLQYIEEGITTSNHILDSKRDDNTGDASDLQRPILQAGLNSSTLSLPDSVLSSSSLRKDEFHHSSQVLPDAERYLTFDTPNRVMSVSTHDQLEDSLPPKYEVVTINQHDEMINKGCSKRHTHASTSSSGYVSASPIHLISKNDQKCTSDEGYIHYQVFEDCSTLGNATMLEN